MHIARRKASLSKQIDRLLKSFELVLGEILLSRIVRGREMRHQSINPNILESRQRFTELSNVVGTHSQSTHASVDLDMHIGDHALVSRSAIKRFDHIQPVNNWSQALLQTSAFLAGPKSSETKNGFADARMAQLETFFRHSHAKPIDAFSFQTPSAGNRAMTVRVRLHSGHHANFASNLIANHAQVVRESIEIDLSPRRTPGGVFFNGHRFAIPSPIWERDQEHNQRMFRIL